MKARKRKRNAIFNLLCWMIISIGIAIGVFARCYSKRIEKEVTLESPEKLLEQYMSYIPQKEYDKMYEMINLDASGNISKEDFIKRNSGIYEGIEIKNMKVAEITYNENEISVSYLTSFDTIAGEIKFKNKAYFLKGKNRYELIWNDSLIFPKLSATDKIRVKKTAARRGQILDRNGNVLAGKGEASSVGIVPQKLVNPEKAIKKISKLLDLKTSVIEKKLSAKWVKEDSFVPLKIIPAVKESDLISYTVDEEVLKEEKRHQDLLKIEGVKILNVDIRNYPYKNAAAHFIGYVQNVTAEDLEKHAGEGYSANSVIGKSGIEGLYEKELKGHDGYSIYMMDLEGNKKKKLACLPVENGKDIKLTIDANLQSKLYEQFKEDKSCSVAMNPYTGEVLALVSTPAFNNNDFIIGMSQKQWNALNEDEKKPLFNRFRQVWCPGSTFKPIIAAIGLDSGAIDPNEDYGNVGLKWQKDASWGGYYVTTLHAYNPVILKNALIYSDNIYFAKAALKIGANEIEKSLTKLGFLSQLPFEINMAKSQYSNTEKIESEIQLADSGYGQGQILVNPLHLASIYTAFCNEGNIISPYLLYDSERKPSVWLQNVFSKNTIEQVVEGSKEVINNPHGTGYKAHEETVILAGKTGTAEIKASKDDVTGTELGWFAVYTAEKSQKRPILIVTMVEDVKNRGGSAYVVEREDKVLTDWFEQN